MELCSPLPLSLFLVHYMPASAGRFIHLPPNDGSIYGVLYTVGGVWLGFGGVSF